MRKRRLFWLAAAFCLGILLAERKAFFWGLFLCALLGVWAICAKTWRKSSICMLLGLCVGFCIFTWQYAGYEASLAKIADAIVTVEGRVEAVQTGEKTRLTVRGTIQNDLASVKEGTVYIYPKDAGSWQYGDAVLVRAVASVPGVPQNFGETAYRPYAMGKHLYAFLYPEAGEIQKTGYSFSLYQPKDMAYAARTWLKERISGRTSSAAEAFLVALLTGDQSGIYERDIVALQKAGLSHIVAVSGMHLQVLVTAVMALFGILHIQKRWFSVCCYLLFIWFFVVFTGASASVLRAALMLTVFFFADFLRRDRDALTALAFAVLFLGLANPGIVFDIGFQLSCTSTLAILLFAPKIEACLRMLPRLLRISLSTTVTAFLGFAPIAAYYFGILSTMGVLANLLVCPLVTPVMVGGFFASLTAQIPILSTILFWALDRIVCYILAVAKVIASLPFSVQMVTKPGTLDFMAYLAGVVGIYLWFCKRRWQTLYAFLLAVTLLEVQLLGSWMMSKTVQVSFLSVGNGDCALVTMGKTAVLFDSGGSIYTDVAEKTVIPYIRNRGLLEIEAAFLTHYHTDHGAAYLRLMEEGLVRTLFLPSHADSDLKPALAAMAAKTGTAIRYLGDGDTVQLGALSVSAFDSNIGTDENNGLLYRMESFGVRLLFTGDIDKKGERRLVWRGADLDCDILKVPHHGASTAGSEEFTAATSPSLAVISCGENSYGHPSQTILSNYAERNIPVYRTDQNGTVEITILPNGWYFARTLWK